MMFFPYIYFMAQVAYILKTYQCAMMHSLGTTAIIIVL